MDHEKTLRQFDEIEEKVGKLIDVCKSLEATNLELKNKIGRLEEELQGKVEAENNYQEERALIRSKIDSLLIRLEDITETQ
ncbi:MAG: cell division protein ZapB [Pseudomonadota bacterium]|uniref:Cell division protein ZapB n=1 Tax=Candidatus Desulfatibia profunda TaxID=2841695 RepID=A0A8J6TND9_9BACT|nr:cell division protein ZapB [Candidatus Desulfatibia profunda]MBL7179364.1 cell division protein ZapB [Desulfobacterales bacterium]